MQNHKLLLRDIDHYHIPKTILARKLHISRQTLYARLGIDNSPMFYNDVEQAISSILHWRHMKYAKEDSEFKSKER